MTDQAEGVRIGISGTGLPQGPKGLHIYAVATCDPPDFVSAGAQFNPTGKRHGRVNPGGPHAGDLPNVVVPGLLFGERGTSLVVHAQADDEKTDPTGKNGGWIACGVITRS